MIEPLGAEFEKVYNGNVDILYENGKETIMEKLPSPATALTGSYNDIKSKIVSIVSDMGIENIIKQGNDISDIEGLLSLMVDYQQAYDAVIGRDTLAKFSPKKDAA